MISQIDYEEFLAATMHLNKLSREENMMAAFEYFDTGEHSAPACVGMLWASLALNLWLSCPRGVHPSADKSGFITRDELVSAMKDIDQDVDFDTILAQVRICASQRPQLSARRSELAASLVTRIFHASQCQVDRNGDGRIDYEEFCLMMRTHDMDVLKNAKEVRAMVVGTAQQDVCLRPHVFILALPLKRGHRRCVRRSW